MFTLPLLIGGTGLGVTIAPMFQTVLSGVPPRDAGSGSGALQAFQQVGGALGVALMGGLFFSHLAASLQSGAAREPPMAMRSSRRSTSTPRASCS